MICGSRQSGTLHTLAPNTLYASKFTLAAAGVPIKTSVVAGPGPATTMTAVIYSAAGALLGSAPTLLGARSATRTVVDLALPLLSLGPGALWLGVYCSAATPLALTDTGVGLLVAPNSSVTNLLTNPSFELAVAPWFGTSGTLTRSQTWAPAGSGSWSLGVTSTPATGVTANAIFDLTGAGVNTGTYYSAVATINKTDTIARGVRLVLIAVGGPSNGTTLTNYAQTSASGVSVLSASATVPLPAGATTVRMQVDEVNDGAAATANYQIDAALLVNSATLPSSAFDGDRPGYAWTGTPHASSSYRLPVGGATLDVATPLIAGELQIFMLLDGETPLIADDMTLAAQGSISAQRALRTSPDPQSLLVGNCGWHGQAYDAPRGMLAIVSANGPFAGLVGERVLVTERFTSRSCVVKIHTDDSAFATPILEDLSLTRRAFMLIGLASADELAIEVQTML